MTQSDYLWPGLAAIAAAVLLPAFWVWELGYSGLFDYREYLHADLRIADLVFLLIGGLTIYIYVALKRILHDHQNYRSLDVPLSLIVGASVVFHLGVFLMAVLATMKPGTPTENFAAWFWVIFIVLFGVLDIVIAVLLLRDRQQLPNLLMIFAIVSLVLGVMELSVIFSFAAIALLPLALFILALHFLHKPELIEIV